MIKIQGTYLFFILPITNISKAIDRPLQASKNAQREREMNPFQELECWMRTLTAGTHSVWAYHFEIPTTLRNHISPHTAFPVTQQLLILEFAQTVRSANNFSYYFELSLLKRWLGKNSN